MTSKVRKKIQQKKVEDHGYYKRRPADSEPEFKLITGLIVSTEFCKNLFPILNIDYLQMSYGKRIVKWISNYYKEYDSSPGLHIVDIFNEEKKSISSAEVDVIEAFLTNLSKEYEKLDKLNFRYLLDQSIEYMNERGLSVLANNILTLLDANKLEKAKELFLQHHTLATPDLIGFEEGFTGTELSNMEIHEPSWIIKGILPMGLTLLAGKPKTGKSFFLFDIAVSVAQGGKNIFDSSIRARKREVLYLALEDSKKRLKDRWIKMVGEGVILDDIHIFPGRSWPKLNNGGLQKLETWMEEHTKTKLVIIDILEKVRSRPKAQGYFYADDYQTISQLQEFASKHKIGFVVVHHTNKSKTEDVFDEISSTTGLTGAADTIAVLSKVDTGRADRVYSVTGRDIEDKRLAFKFDNFRWKLLGDADEYRMSKERKGIVDLIRESGRPMKRDEIVRERSPKKGTDVLLKKLVDSGEIEKYGYGQYVIKGYVEKEITKGLIKSRRFIHKEN